MGAHNANSITSHSNLHIATGNVSGSGSNVGGLVGRQNTGVSIENCFATGDVSGNFTYVGGLVGYQYGDSITITNSYATGNVTTSGVSSNVGGLVGYQYYYSSSSSGSNRIINSYATGNVTATNGSAVGGLVGSISSSGGNIANF
jgi:hypothetical protein